MDEMYDAIIVGGGFSGVTAARELRLLGHNVLLLEARDRLGGRTWTDSRLGFNLEMGGTYVHWYQPHVWSEITRYGLEITAGPKPERVYWITNGETRSAPFAEFRAKFKESVERLMSESNKYIPLPYEPLASPLLKQIDNQSSDEFMKAFDLTKEEYDMIHGWVASDFCGAPEDGAVTQIMRWWVFSQGNWNIHSAAISGFRLKDGTASLIKAIAEDAEATIHLSTTVKKVEQKNNKVIVSTAKNETFTAKAIIVTAPLTTLQHIEFIPPLSAAKQASSKEGQTSKGMKMWALVKGNLEPFDALAPGNYPLNSVHLDRYSGENSILVGFGPSAMFLDPNNREDVEKALRHWIPTIEVIESTGHDWVHDEFSLEAWPMLKPDQLTTYFDEWRKEEEGLFLAGTTYASGWASFIDGAIESGMTVGRRVHKYLLENEKS